MAEQKKVCVLEATLKRKGGVVTLRLRSDVLPDVFDGLTDRTPSGADASTYLVPGSVAVPVGGGPGLRVYAFETQRADALVPRSTMYTDSGKKAWSPSFGTNKPIVSGDYLYLNLLALRGLKEGVELTLPDLLVSVQAMEAWVQAAKEWATAAYNNSVRGVSFGVRVEAVMEVEQPAVVLVS